MIIDGSNFVPNGVFRSSSEKSHKSVSQNVGSNFEARVVEKPAFASAFGPSSHFSPANRPVSENSLPNLFPKPNALYDCDGIAVDDRVICLSGQYFTLSNYYAAPIFVKKKRYRSVEHYVFEKFFRHLKLSDKYIEKISTTSDPLHLPTVAAKFIPRHRFTQLSDDERTQLTEWYDRAMRHKLKTYQILCQLLLSTGSALLVETNNVENDSFVTSGVSEAQMHFLLTRLEVNNGTILRAFLGQLSEDLPEKIQKSVRLFGANLTGVMLMRLRSILQSQLQAGVLRSFPLLSTKPSPLTQIDLESVSKSAVVCFSEESVFHPKYLSPFWMIEDPFLMFPSVSHFIYVEAAKYFDFSDRVVEDLLQQPAEKVVSSFQTELRRRYPDPAKYHNWFNQVFENSLLTGCRAKFELHADLLRCLLDTGDSLLVYCHRYSTATADLSIGMRESEFREWIRVTGITNTELINMMLVDPVYRLPFLGSNRLGFMLMLLRKEFRTKPVKTILFSELSTKQEVAYGHNTALETGDDFDTKNTPSAFLLWPNPYVQIVKGQNKRLWYPRKRRLPGYHADGHELEEKRRSLPPHYMVHPEYTSATNQTRGFFIPIEAVDFHADKPYTLVDMCQDLLKRANFLRDTIQQQETDLTSLMDEMYDRNDLELVYGPIIKLEKSLPVETEKSDEKVNKIPASEKEEGEIVKEESDETIVTTLQSKLSALKLGFEKYLLLKGKKIRQKVDGRDEETYDKTAEYATFSTVFDLGPNIEESKAKFIVDHLYKHLSEQQKCHALNWLIHAVTRMNDLRATVGQTGNSGLNKSAGILDNSENSLKLFVPLSPKKSEIEISHSLIFEKEDLNE